jgi:hypothetical protein
MAKSSQSETKEREPRKEKSAVQQTSAASSALLLQIFVVLLKLD